MGQLQAMKIASYVMKTDAGFAPNPYFGFCTLSACTPNYRNYDISPGDWIVGVSDSASGNRLVYAMNISETMDHDAYFRDERFAEKKPDPSGSWQKRCGDNIYCRDERGDWVSFACVYHTEPEFLDRDTRHSKVYVAEEFYYLGDRMIRVPDDLADVLHAGRGLRYERDPTRVRRFLEWLKRNVHPGLQGRPRHRSLESGCGTRTSGLSQKLSKLPGRRGGCRPASKRISTNCR